MNLLECMFQPMMRIWRMARTRIGFICAGICILSACASKESKQVAETIPIVRVMPNSTGITIDDIKSHGPINLVVENGPPDIPSGITAAVESRETGAKPGESGANLGELDGVSIERPSAYDYGTDKFTRTIDEWRLLMDGSVAKAEAENILFENQLDEIPWQNAGRGYPAKIHHYVFAWGRCVAFITSGYAQGPMPGQYLNNDDLTLVVQGFTNDGRYVVHAHLAIHHPELPSSADDGRMNRKVKLLIDTDAGDERAAGWLDAQPDALFAPSFTQYAAFLRSLQIAAPTKK